MTVYLPDDDVTLRSAPAVGPGEDDYNIPVAELNALNAILAVVQWKRHLGFYATHEQTSQTVYKLYLNELRNGEVA